MPPVPLTLAQVMGKFFTRMSEAARWCEPAISSPSADPPRPDKTRPPCRNLLIHPVLQLRNILRLIAHGPTGSLCSGRTGDHEGAHTDGCSNCGGDRDGGQP